MKNDSLIFDRAKLREIDRRAVEEFGIPILALMENAGRQVAEAVMRMHPAAKNVLIIAGSGNNGGDGLAAARHLANAGAQVRILLVGETKGGPFETQLHIAEKMGIAIETASPGHAELRDWVVEGETADVIVDALFGTGLSRKVEGIAAEVIAAMNKSGRRIVAVDIPSGLDADSGEILGVAVRAVETVSFCGLKKGFMGAGKGCCGKVIVADIGVPARLLKELALRA